MPKYLSDKFHHNKYFNVLHVIVMAVQNEERNPSNEPPHDKTNKMASAQSDQSLHCPHEESLGP